MDWTALLVAEDENPRSRLVTELLASDAYGSMQARAAAFVRQGGGCRATFFNYRSERVIRCRFIFSGKNGELNRHRISATAVMLSLSFFWAVSHR